MQNSQKLREITELFTSLFKLKKLQVQKWRRVQEKTIKYIKAQSGIFNFANVKNYIKSETEIEISWLSISSFLKNKLGFSYKRVSSRPSASSILQNKLKLILFWLEFANLIKPEHVIVNIDETLFTRSTKFNYSWSVKGVWWTANNSAFVGSLSLIAAIKSKGNWFISNLLSCNNSDSFISFIQKLIVWLQQDFNIEASRIVLLMDNSKVHTSNKWM